MSEKVVQLNVIKAGPNAELVERLEEFLTMARNGELTSLFAVGLCRDGQMLGGSQMNGSDSIMLMLGCIESTKRDFMNQYIEPL